MPTLLSAGVNHMVNVTIRYNSLVFPLPKTTLLHSAPARTKGNAFGKVKRGRGLRPRSQVPAHAAAIEAVGKAALDDLGAQLEGLAGERGLEPHAVVGDRPARRLVTAPARKALLPEVQC